MPVGGRGSRSVSALDRLINEADYLYVQGRSTEALRKIERALRVAPGQAEALIIKGRILRSLGRSREAMACFDEAVRRTPSSGEGFLERARSFYGRDNRRALREVGKAIARARRQRWVKAQALLLQGKILGDLDRDGEAITSYLAALRLEPKNIETHWDLGGSLLLTGELIQGVRHFETALRLTGEQRDPDQALLFLNIEANAVTLHRMGLHERALQLIRASLRHVRQQNRRSPLRVLYAQIRRSLSSHSRRRRRDRSRTKPA